MKWRPYGRHLGSQFVAYKLATIAAEQTAALCAERDARMARRTKEQIACGQRVRLAREAAGLTLGQAARILACRVTRLSDVEWGLEELTTAERIVLFGGYR